MITCKEQKLTQWEAMLSFQGDALAVVTPLSPAADADWPHQRRPRIGRKPAAEVQYPIELDPPLRQASFEISS